MEIHFEERIFDHAYKYKFLEFPHQKKVELDLQTDKKFFKMKSTSEKLAVVGRNLISNSFGIFYNRPRGQRHTRTQDPI